MSAPADPKSAKALQGSGAAFFAVGVTFFVLGLTNRDMTAFVGVGGAFFAIGLGMIAKARNAPEVEKARGEGDR